MAKSKPNNNKPNETQVTPEEKHVDLSQVVADEVEKQMGGLNELIDKKTKSATDDGGLTEDVITGIVTRVLEQVNQEKATTETPSWKRVDPETIYDQCLERALHIVTNGQTLQFMQGKRNCKMLMNHAVSLANEMFDRLADEYEIPS